MVPYNPYLLKKYRCQINVEVAATVNLMAYLYKYIYKSHDHVRYTLQHVAQTENSAVDEIAQYILAHFVGSAEAAWQLLGYIVNRRQPVVEVLPVHSPGE